MAPLLKVQRRADTSKDWRAHVDWINSLLKTIDKTFPDVKGSLDKIVDDLSKALEKIQKREQALYAQFEVWVDKYRAQKKDFTSVQVRVWDGGWGMSTILLRSATPATSQPTGIWNAAKCYSGGRFDHSSFSSGCGCVRVSRMRDCERDDPGKRVDGKHVCVLSFTVSSVILSGERFLFLSLSSPPL